MIKAINNVRFEKNLSHMKEQFKHDPASAVKEAGRYLINQKWLDTEQKDELIALLHQGLEEAPAATLDATKSVLSTFSLIAEIYEKILGKNESLTLTAGQKDKLISIVQSGAQKDAEHAMEMIGSLFEFIPKMLPEHEDALLAILDDGFKTRPQPALEATKKILQLNSLCNHDRLHNIFKQAVAHNDSEICGKAVAMVMARAIYRPEKNSEAEDYRISAQPGLQKILTMIFNSPRAADMARKHIPESIARFTEITAAKPGPSSSLVTL